MYNHSLRTADRSTHLKVVLVPLVAAALFAAAVVNLGTVAGAQPQSTHSAVVRAGTPSAYASSAQTFIR